MVKSLVYAFVAAVVLKCDSITATSVRRHLSYEMIAYYEPKTQVTDQNAIDLDQEAIEFQLSMKTDESFQVARDIYTNGGYSKSVAEVTLTTPLRNRVKIGTSVTGKNSEGKLVVGELLDDYKKGDSTIGVRYKTTDIQESYVSCQVGGLSKPKLDGCLAASGMLKLKIDGVDTDLSYSYDPKTKNINKRTIKGFSTDAEQDMYRCAGNCPYSTYKKFRDYYGAFDYADKWITAAFEKSSTNFARSNANFAQYSVEGRAEAIKKGSAYMSIWMYVIRQIEDALDNCKEGCTTNGCNDISLHSWDSAVALYTGSLEGTDGSGDGKLAYALADKRCKNFKTCGDMASEIEGTSHVNQEVIRSFALGQRKLSKGQCAEAKPYKERVEQMMIVPLIQGTLRYAYVTSTDKNADEKAEAEGAVFAASILPLIHACDEDAATTIYKNMKTGQKNTANFDEVNAAFVNVYSCLGIRGSDVGGIYNPETGDYYVGAEPLDSKTSSKSNNINVGLIVGCVIAGIVAGIVLYFLASKFFGGSGRNKHIVTANVSKATDNDTKAEITNSDGEVVEIS